jgi:hypothetical protein
MLHRQAVETETKAGEPQPLVWRLTNGGTHLHLKSDEVTSSFSRSAVPTEKKVQRDVAARWTQKLADGGWTPICDAFLDSYRRLTPPITNMEAILVVHLMRYKWDTSAPYPGFARLAGRMGLTMTAVRNHARSLEQKGYLQRKQRVGSTNKFDLTPLFRALEAYEPPKKRQLEAE